METHSGIGQKDHDYMIKHFKSVKRIKEASEKEISEVIGLSKAKKFPTFTKK